MGEESECYFLPVRMYVFMYILVLLDTLLGGSGNSNLETTVCMLVDIYMASLGERTCRLENVLLRK